jgi:hypothetical protein
MTALGAASTRYRFDLGGEFTRLDLVSTLAYLGIATEYVTLDIHLRGERAHDLADSGVRANLAVAPKVGKTLWPYARNRAIMAHNIKANAKEPGAEVYIHW